MMVIRSDFCWHVPNIFLVALLVTFSAAREVCDKSKCPGPLAYYKGLECKPIYKTPNDCCPEAYDCNHLKNLSKDKCYVNGKAYNIGEPLNEEDANPCDVACICTQTSENEAPSFVCAQVLCPVERQLSDNNCFVKYSHDSCCPYSWVCLKEGEKRATCEVDGKIYQEGQHFESKSDPELNCYCKPGYKGKNVAPFCNKSNRNRYSSIFVNAKYVHRNCVPVNSFGERRETDYNFDYKCPNEYRTFTPNHDAKAVVGTDENKICRFGNLTMHIGDELRQRDIQSISYGIDDSKLECVICVCEVPPFPTCTVDHNVKLCGI